MMDITLIGGGGHSISCIDVIESHSAFNILGIVDNKLSNGDLVSGYPVIGSDDDLDVLIKKNPNFLIAIGQIKSPSARKQAFTNLQGLGASFPHVISPFSYFSSGSKLGDGSIVMHGAVVNRNVSIGKNCIINSNALIEHDAEVGPNCHISTGSIINGGANIGEGTFIGSGAILKEGIRIGSNVVIGAGQLILSDIPDNEILAKRQT